MKLLRFFVAELPFEYPIWEFQFVDLDIITWLAVVLFKC